MSKPNREGQERKEFVVEQKVLSEIRENIHAHVVRVRCKDCVCVRFAISVEGKKGLGICLRIIAIKKDGSDCVGARDSSRFPFEIGTRLELQFDGVAIIRRQR